MRLTALALAALCLCSCPSTPPAACTSDSSCSGGRCIAGACFTRACGDTMCGLARVCSSGACIDEQCVNKTCDPGSACVRGDCLATKCGNTPCAAGEVCDAAKNLCVEASCYGVVCPSGQTCAAGACSGGMSCGGSTCTSTQACVSDVCVAKCGGTNCAVGQACDTAVNTCVEPACVGVRCDGGTCMAGACVDPLCVGVSCDAGVCQGGTCHDACELSCALPCAACMNGRSCNGVLECTSRYCASNVCTACTSPSQCPNGGSCMNGICRSGLLGPCASTLDCVPGNLVCDHDQCRLPLNASCSADAECIQSLRCENLVCQRPRCLMTLVEVQAPPAVAVPQTNQAMGLQANGEIYVTAGQWQSGGNTDIRRFRVSPGGDAGIVEQAPTSQPYISGPTDILAQGHSDAPGSGFITTNVQSPRRFHWMPAGGAFDGRVAVIAEFSGFNADAFPNLTNLGRFAKCGDNFYFAMQSSTTTSGRVLLRFTPPNPTGSGTTVQTLTTSSARRDNNVFTYFNDLNCTASALYVIGEQGGQVRLQLLDPMTLADRGTAISLAPIQSETGVGDLNLAIVDDTYIYVLGVRGEAYQCWDGGATNLGNSNFSTITSNGLNWNANAQGAVVEGYDGRIYRYARRLMNGQTPPPDLDCQWQ